MTRWLIVLLIIVVLAIIWYWQRERAREAELRRAAESRRVQGASRATELPPLAVALETQREGGAFQAAADAAAGRDLEQATARMQAMSADLAAAREEAEQAAARRGEQADAALAAVQAAAAAHGGAVPGDGTHDCPSDYSIKGNLSSMIYHVPGQRAYARTIPEVCFQSAEAAAAAGFSPAKAEAVVVEGVVAEVAEAPGAPEAIFAEALVASDRESGARSDIVAEAIAAADVGSVPPGAIRGDGGRDCPPAYPIKGNQSSMLYHEPDSPTYQSTIPVFCFSSVESATAAGFSATRF